VSPRDREALFWLNAALIMNIMDSVCKLRLSACNLRQIHNGIYDAVIIAATRKATDRGSDST
jgi:ribosomal protein L28